MKFTVVTTFNSAGYELYGRRMIQTFLQNWPQKVQLVVYAEDCVVAESAENLQVVDLSTASVELTAFKQQWKHVPKATGNVSNDPVRSRRKDAGKGFKWDAVRFAHKVYAIFHCAKSAQTDCLLWMDGDTVCHSPITVADLERLCPPDKDICFLGRKNKYTECGLYAMNLQSSRTQDFLTQFQQYYDQAEQGIFTLDEWHDSFVFDAVRKQHPLMELDWSGHLVSGEGHPLINSEWGAYLDHLKGSRKDLGRSKNKDLLVNRLEKYWLQHS
jgi:hypothetical protein